MLAIFLHEIGSDRRIGAASVIDLPSTVRITTGVRSLSFGVLALCYACAPDGAAAQSLPASPASSTEKPGKEETAPAKDDTGLIITGSTRFRYETVDGRPRPGYATSEDAYEIRSGIAVEYGPGPLGVGAELIDSRAYGLGRKTLIGHDDVNPVELPQAYLRLKLPNALGEGKALNLQGGRFLLNIGSGRLVATDEYRNTVSGFTGLQAELKPDKQTTLTLFYVLPQERLPTDVDEIRRNKVVFDRETFDDVFFGAHWQRKQVLAGAQIELAYFRLAEHDSPGRATADRRLHTVDARLYREAKAAKFDFDVEGAYQFGDASVSTDADARHSHVAAGLLHAAGGYTFAGKLKPRLSLFYDYATGNHGKGDFNRFDTLFGSRREDLGPSGTYSAIARENISAPGVRFEAKPGRFETLVDYRAVWLASRTDRFYGVTDATGASGDFGGHQVEGRFRYWIIPDHLRLESNFAILFKGDFLLNAPTALARDKHEVRLIEANIQETF